MSLKHKFKTESAPLVQNDEVKLIKEKFAHGKKSKQPDAECPNTCLRTKPQSVSWTEFLSFNCQISI